MKVSDEELPEISDIEQARRDAMRIGAEIGGRDRGTDPFVAAVRATRMPMVITDPRQPDNPIVFVNDAFCRLSGYERAEIVGHNCRFLQGPRTDRESVAKVRAALQDVRAIEIDLLNYRKDGETFWNRLLLAPVHDATGELAYFFASQLDVTLERERLEDLENSNAALIAELAGRLREQQASEDELRFTLEAARFGAWSLTLPDHQLTASATCRLNFGWTVDRPFTYADLLAAIHPDDRDRVQQELGSSISQRTDCDIDFRVVLPDADVRFVTMRGRASHLTDGTPYKMTGISLDITERVRAERMRKGLVALSDAFRDLDNAADISFTAGRILGETLDVDRAGYGTVDPVAETITIERDWNAPGVESLAGTLRFRDYGSYIEDLVRGETVVIEDADTDPRTRDYCRCIEGDHRAGGDQHARHRAGRDGRDLLPQPWAGAHLARGRNRSSCARLPTAPVPPSSAAAPSWRCGSPTSALTFWIRSDARRRRQAMPMRSWRSPRRMVGRTYGRFELRLCRCRRRSGWLYHSRRMGCARFAEDRRRLQPRIVRQAAVTELRAGRPLILQ